MKNLHIFLLCCLGLPMIAVAQNPHYYVQLEDASGGNTVPYQDSLDAHAYALVQALPDVTGSQSGLEKRTELPIPCPTAEDILRYFSSGLHGDYSSLPIFVSDSSFTILDETLKSNSIED